MSRKLADGEPSVAAAPWPRKWSPTWCSHPGDTCRGSWCCSPLSAAPRSGLRSWNMSPDGDAGCCCCCRVAAVTDTETAGPPAGRVRARALTRTGGAAAASPSSGGGRRPAAALLRLVAAAGFRAGESLHERQELVGLHVDDLGGHHVDDDRLPLLLPVLADLARRGVHA
jgi:hypothetical protein